MEVKGIYGVHQPPDTLSPPKKTTLNKTMRYKNVNCILGNKTKQEPIEDKEKKILQEKKELEGHTKRKNIGQKVSSE